MKAQYQGQEVEASEVEVISAGEHWNEYQLADGRVLLLKTVITGIQRLKGCSNPDGSPLYQFQTHFVTRVK